MSVSRRHFLVCGSLALSAGLTQGAMAGTAGAISPALLRRALEALDRHDIPNRDRIAIADFSLPSRMPRFHLVDMAGGGIRSHLVAHGRGSDPNHTGWLERFSNGFGSNATSAGSYRTEGLYTGAHGRSIRLKGLDASNNNALERGIVVHGAWYVNRNLAQARGVLGRSEGCFAFADESMEEIMARLGPGHLIYADKIESG